MAKAFTVRPLRAADLDRILEIENASFGREAYQRNLFAHYLRSCGSLFLVAERRRRIGGYMVSCIARGRAELISIAVDPAERGKGAASRMMESTLRRLRRRAVPKLTLMVRSSNQAARGFYEKFGFRKLRTVPQYYEDGEDGVLMTTSL